MTLTCGIGKCVYANGDVYEGEWWDDKKEGVGKLTLADGSILQGEWDDDEFVGE